MANSITISWTKEELVGYISNISAYVAQTLSLSGEVAFDVNTLTKDNEQTFLNEKMAEAVNALIPHFSRIISDDAEMLKDNTYGFTFTPRIDGGAYSNVELSNIKTLCKKIVAGYILADWYSMKGIAAMNNYFSSQVIQSANSLNIALDRFVRPVRKASVSIGRITYAKTDTSYTHINNRSDFVLVWGTSNGSPLPNAEYDIDFYTNGEVIRTVNSLDRDIVKPIEGSNNKVRIIFDFSNGEHFANGVLGYIMRGDIQDADFPDGSRHFEQSGETTIEIWDGPSDTDKSVTATYVPSYMKLEFSDLSESDIAVLQAPALEAVKVANEATASANEAAVGASSQGNYAKDQGDYAKNQGSYARSQADNAYAQAANAQKVANDWTGENGGIGYKSIIENTISEAEATLDAKVQEVDGYLVGASQAENERAEVFAEKIAEVEDVTASANSAAARAEEKANEVDEASSKMADMVERISSVITVEIGTYADSDGITPTERTTRARTSIILRKDLVGQTIAPPIGYYAYIFLLDKKLNKVGVNNWISSATPPLDIDSLPENVAYLTMALKNSYNGDTVISENDLDILKSWAGTELSPIAKIGDWLYALRYNHGKDGAITIKDGVITIQAAGFGIAWKGDLYYVANPDTAVSSPYKFNLGQYAHHYLVLRTSRLLNKDARNDLTTIVAIQPNIKEGDIPIAYHYMNNQITLLGQFKDLFYVGDENTQLSAQNINTDIFFDTEYYSFNRGKKLDSQGVGQSWFNRFALGHFTDIHNYYALFAEGLSVVQSKVAGVVNCGDDSRGVSASDAETVKADLTDVANVVSNNNTLPYVPNVGNHDFTGLTKQEYFERVCSNLSGMVWGDAANYRVYGYRDFTDDAYEGNYRIISLDPFDYEDGLYSVVYFNNYVVFSQTQIDWLMDTLIDAAAKGLKVITTMHYSFGDDSLPFGEDLAKPDAKFCQDAFMIPDIIKAIQTKGALNRDYTDVVGENNITINRDFSNAPSLDFVCHLFGHIHSKNSYQCQKTNGEKYDILMLGELSLAQNGVALAKTYRTQGTVNDISFSVLAIDPTEKAIYRIAYGAYRDYSDPTKDNRVTKIPYRFSD